MDNLHCQKCGVGVDVNVVVCDKGGEVRKGEIGMFKITQNKGFHITFENGWTVSVQFGRGNYCDNRDLADGESKVDPSSNAEIAAWDENKNWHEFEGGDTVDGWVKPDDVLKFMNMIAAKGRAHD